MRNCVWLYDATAGHSCPGNRVEPTVPWRLALGRDLVAGLGQPGDDRRVADRIARANRDDLGGDIDVDLLDPVDLAQLAGDRANAVLAAHVGDEERLLTLKRPLGAEEAEYAQAGLFGRPANYPFQSTEELQLVLGIPPGVFQRIAPMITVYSRQSGVNPQLASRGVLLAIPGVTAEAVDLFLAEREAARAEGRMPPIFTAAGAYASYARTAAATIRADVRLGDGIVVSREAVAMLTPQYPRRPYTLLAWREVSRDRDARESQAPGTEAADGKPR